jgi:amino acid transporter
MSSETQAASSGQERDSEDLARFGYSQELKRSLGLFSSFAVAFSYISPSTGIFTLFALGLTTLGGVFIWTWPVVALGQFIVALNFAEVSSHYPVAGSVFQWTKFLANRTYSWFTGWIYLFAGILTVTAVVATLPLALLPSLDGLGWHAMAAGTLHQQLVTAAITLVVIACGVAFYYAGQRTVQQEQINDLHRLASLVRTHLSGDAITALASLAVLATVLAMWQVLRPSTVFERRAISSMGKQLSK